MTHKTIKELNKEIKEQRERISKEEELRKKVLERQNLQRELFRLRNKGLIGVGEKAKRISSRFKRGFIGVGKKVGPVLQKQATLIRQQQLRDQRLEEIRSKGIGKKTIIKRKKIKKLRIPTKTKLIFVPGLGMVSQKIVQKKIKPKKRKIKISKPKAIEDTGIFSNLDF